MANSGFINSPVTPYTPAQVQNFPVEYFSGVDTSIFFGNQYIDEICELTFTIEENVYPIYSYANYTANTIVHGTRLIRGTFCINMRPGDYLHEMMYGDLTQGLDGVTVTPYNGSLVAADDLTQNIWVDNTFVIPGSAVYYDNPDQFNNWSTAQQQAFWTGIGQAGQASSTDLSKSQYFENCGWTILLVYGDLDTIDISRNIGRVRTINSIHPFRVTQKIDMSGENIQELWEFYSVDMNAQNRIGSLYDNLQVPYTIPGSQ